MNQFLFLKTRIQWFIDNLYYFNYILQCVLGYLYYWFLDRLFFYLSVDLIVAIVTIYNTVNCYLIQSQNAYPFSFILLYYNVVKPNDYNFQTEF